MLSPKLLAILASGFLLAPALGQVPKPAIAQGQSTIFELQVNVLADTDQDGLDDGLEVLLGSSVLSADTDDDGMSDLEEVVFGTNPRVPDTPAANLSPAVYAGVYALDGRVVVQLFALHSQGVAWSRFLWVRGDNQAVIDVPPELIRPALVDVRDFSASEHDGWQIEVVRLNLPQSRFEGRDESGFAVTAVMEGAEHGAAVNFTHLDGRLARVVPYGVNLGIPNKIQGPLGGRGGIFPVDPNPPEPFPNRSESGICVAELMPVGGGGGVVIYQVVSASCDESDGNVKCEVAACEASIGTQIIGVDVIGLIGQS